MKSVSIPANVSGSSRRTRNSQLETRNCRYHVTVAAGRNSKRRYSAAQIDFVAVLVVPHHGWYIIPVAALGGQVSISLRPGIHPPNRFERFREAWDLLATAD